MRAQIRRLDNYSAHADQLELIDWIIERGPARGGLFLNHGEDPARSALKNLLVERGLSEDKIFLPQFDEKFDLVPNTPPTSQGVVEPRIECPTHHES